MKRYSRFNKYDLYITVLREDKTRGVMYVTKEKYKSYKQIKSYTKEMRKQKARFRKENPELTILTDYCTIYELDNGYHKVYGKCLNNEFTVGKNEDPKANILLGIQGFYL